MTTIGEYAFRYAEFDTISLPTTLSLIKRGAFVNSKIGVVNINDLKAYLSVDMSVSANSSPFFSDGLEISQGATGRPLSINGEIVENLVIPSGVTEIGARAFSWAAIKSVVIPEGVEIIGKYAFDTSPLEEVWFPSSLKSVLNTAFWDNINMKRVNIPSFADWMEIEFANTSANPLGGGYGNHYDDPQYVTDLVIDGTVLTDLVIPGSYEIVPQFQFIFASIKSVKFEEGVKTIGRQAFVCCHNITQLNQWPASLETIEFNAFNMLYGLKDLTLPAIPNLDMGAFRLSTVENLTIPAEYCVPELPSAMILTDLKNVIVEPGNQHYSLNDKILVFDGNMLMMWIGEIPSELIIPENITAIGRYALSASSIEKVVFPEGFNCISLGAISSCSNLKSVVFTDLDVEDMVIEKSAFSGCSSLEEITLPNSVKAIPDFCFNNCSSLASITLPNDLKTIGSQAFFTCGALKEVVLPEGTETIDKYAFEYCSALEKIQFPKSLVSIGVNSFSSCNALTNITCLSPEPPQCNESEFYIAYDVATLYVPEASIALYAEQAPWSNFTHVVGLSEEEGINDIDKEAICWEFADGALQLNANAYVKAYSIDGRVAFQGNASRIALPAGLYIININGKNAKVRF